MNREAPVDTPTRQPVDKVPIGLKTDIKIHADTSLALNSEAHNRLTCSYGLLSSSYYNHLNEKIK